MSQAGQVLHLYVEVRSVGQDRSTGADRGPSGTAHLTLPCPDVLPHSSALLSPATSPAHSPEPRLLRGRGHHSLPPPSSSSSSSRHSVSFQLQNPDGTGSPARLGREDFLSDFLAGRGGGGAGQRRPSLGHAPPPSDPDPYWGMVPISPSSTCSGSSTVPTTPTFGRRSGALDPDAEDGRRSVVTFGFIEKGTVRSPSGRTAPTQNHFRRTEEPQPGPAHLRKRLSDPAWPNAAAAAFRCQNPGPRGAAPHHLQRAPLEEFGSPELRRWFGGTDGCSTPPTLPRHRAPSAPRCRSWGGSPVLPRNTRTLPAKSQLLDAAERAMFRGAANGFPRSPASDQLFAQSGFCHSAPLHSGLYSPDLPPPLWTGDRSPGSSNKFHPPLPAGRPTDIEVPPASPSPDLSQRRTGYRGNCDRFRASADDVSGDRNLYRGCGDSVPPTYGRRTMSPSVNANVACALAMEASRMSGVFAGRRSPSPADSLRSDSPRTGLSTRRESYQYATLRGRRSLEPPQADEQNHDWKTGSCSPSRPGSVSPQTGVSSPALAARLHRAAPSHSPVLDPRQRNPPPPAPDPPDRRGAPQSAGDGAASGSERSHSFNGSAEILRRHLSSVSPDGSPVSWTSRSQDRRETGPVRERDRDQRRTDHSLHLPTKDHRNQNGSDQPLHGDQRRAVAQRKKVQDQDQDQDQDQTGSAGTSSHSSSGVTGSVGDASQQDGHETSSQSSHDTADTGSGIQSDSGSAVTPPSRSQRIARAKWEFLFGQSDESSCAKEVSGATPPTSGSPSPAPPSPPHPKPANHRRGRAGRGQRSSHHRVRQIEVELLTPCASGPKPKTGIIRRTIKYSETDLDLVPLRCYRETDLDEVMRAEAEAAEEAEADSAFGSVLGNSSLSPAPPTADPAPKLCGGAREEEPEEEEGVASWASVRMLGDRQRQRAAEDEVFSLLLRGPLEASSECLGSLKSPVSVGSPRLPSDGHLDSFSRHFENIMESHRAKGTSYSSLDSVDLLTSGSTSVFTFDLPTLTPEIQSQICDSAKQIMELSFAPLARPDPASASSRSELSLWPSGGAGPQNDSAPPVRSRSEKDSWRRSNIKDGFRKATSAPSLHSSPRERAVAAPRPPELLRPQADVAQRLALGGSDDMLANGTKVDLQAARRLAKRLYHLDGFRKSDVARHLSKNNEFSQKVAEEYLSNFNFSGLTVDQALRLFLGHFALMGETQERERVLAHFSRRFTQCNHLHTEDSVHTLTCAVMLLNSDLHGNNVGKRMSCSQFISNLEGLNDGKDFPKDQLKSLYSSIKNEKLQWTIDEEELRKSMSELADVRTDSASHTLKRLGGGGNPLMGVAQQADGELYKSGFLVRKVHADPDGKRTPRGKRGWRSFYAMLKGLVLYLQKDEYRAEQELTEEEVKNAVSVHHALAMRAADYRKRPHVFYLRTADWRVFLLQAPNAEQMQSWITRINVVAAMFSAPPFPAAIGSQKRFSRPLLPGSSTKLSQEEQVKCHESRFRAVSAELSDLTSSSPNRKVKGRELEENKLRQEYLEFEKTRYGTYAMLLRAKLSSGDEDLTAFESRLFDDGGLQRAHSSPALPQDAKDKGRGAKGSKVAAGAKDTTTCTKKSDSEPQKQEEP